MAGNKSNTEDRVFQGSVLVTALIEHYPRCFQSRKDAETFSQRLLQSGHLTCIHADDGKFQDSSFYYRWANETLFQDIDMYSNNIIEDLHIPEKRLSDLIASEMERERGDGGPNHGRYSSLDSDEDFRSSTPKTLALRQQYQDSSLSINDISNIQSAGGHGQKWDTPGKDRNQNYCNRNSKLDFEKIQQENERLRQARYQPQFDHIRPDHSMSENEKHLLEQLKRMQEEHEKVVKSYEDRITELMEKMHELRNIAELLEQSGAKSNPTSPWHSQDQLSRDRPQNGRLTPEGMLSKAETEIPTARRPPPPVPPPPGPTAKVVEPSKPPIRPRVKMRQLFWNRLILPKKNKRGKKNIWQDLSEVNVDIDEFEKLFGKPEKKSDLGRNRQSFADKEKRRSWAKFEGAKILEQNRSRTVAIKMRSMHCQLDEIKSALYNMDFSSVSLESLQGLYQIRATDEELMKMEQYLRSDGLLPLDEPEQFLYEVSRLCHFKERLGSVVFMSKFNETMFNIDQQLLSMQDACHVLSKTTALKTILELVLTLGNYMNGGTHRGQADGFQLEFLNKLKDVKSIQNSFNLLQFIIKIYCREYEEDAGQGSAKFRLPDPSVVRQAAQVSLSETNHELIKMQDQLQSYKLKADTVAKEASRNLVQPFKDKFSDFFSSAENTLKRQADKLQETIRLFRDTAAYLVCDDMIDTVSSEIPITDKFMGTWFTFLVDCKHYWKLEQKTIAKEHFERVERRKRERKTSTVLRASSERNLSRVERRASLKDKFQKIKVENDGRAIQVKEMYKRGDTPVLLNHDSRVSSLASLTNGRSETPVIKEEVQKEQETESAFQPFQRTSALRRSLQQRQRKRQEEEMIPHMPEANPNIELKEPMSMRDTLGNKNAVWSARPIVQEQEIPMTTRVSATVTHQIPQTQIGPPHNVTTTPNSRRGQEITPAVRRRRAASPPVETQHREVSPQGRRDLSPPPLEPRRHRSPPASEQRGGQSPRNGQDHRRERTPTRNIRRNLSPQSNGDRRRELSPGVRENRRTLSPGRMERRRELSPHAERRRELSPPSRPHQRRDLSPGPRSPPSIVNGSIEDVPPPIPRRDRSPRRELSPQRTQYRQPQRQTSRSPRNENHREISPPPVVRQRDQSPAVSSIPVRRRDPSPAHIQRHADRSQDKYADRGRTLSPQRGETNDPNDAQMLRAAAERYTSPARRSRSPPERQHAQNAQRGRQLPETPHGHQNNYQQTSQNGVMDPASPPPIPPLPDNIEKLIQQNHGSERVESRSPVENPMQHTDRNLGRAVPLSERQIQEKAPVRAGSPRIIMASSVSERLQKYENKVKRTNSLRMESIQSGRLDMQSRPRNRAPILDNLRQLEEKLQTEISQRDQRQEGDYVQQAQPAIRSRRYAAKLVRSPADQGDTDTQGGSNEGQNGSVAASRRRRPHSYHSLEGSHLASHFEPQSEKQYNSVADSNNASDQGQYQYQNALRNASMKYNQTRPAKT